MEAALIYIIGIVIDTLGRPLLSFSFFFNKGSNWFCDMVFSKHSPMNSQLNIELF